MSGNKLNTGLGERVFRDDRAGSSLDNHIEELHRAILGAQRLIREYDRAASSVINSWTSRKSDVLATDAGLGEAVVELQRVYERRQR